MAMLAPWDTTLLSVAAKALADPMRLLAIQEVAAHGEMAAGQVLAGSALSKPTISHHLKVLLRAGFLRARRQGKFVYYSLALEAVNAYHHELQRLTSPPNAAMPTTETRRRS
jgi:ArsR family transcriptional regulator, arsenate/arsenite/antimonite-responsive transcriptional repressor